MKWETGEFKYMEKTCLSQMVHKVDQARCLEVAAPGVMENCSLHHSTALSSVEF